MLDAHVVKARAQFTVDVSFAVAAGEACGLFGISGSGKSTILACIAGAETQDAGHVRLGDLVFFPPPLALHRRPVGYMTQDANVFPHLSVAQNVCFGVRAGAAADDAWVEEVRERLDLGPIWGARGRDLSGGQARRVAFARMLARKPRLVLLDEPFGGLDRHLVRELLAGIAAWHARLGFTLVVVDHDAALLGRLTSRAVAIEGGRVVQDAPWSELLEAPATPMLAGLLAPL